MIKDRQRVGFKNQYHRILKREEQLTIEQIQQQREDSALDDVAITSDNYVDKEDYDVPGMVII